jgi:hypothetical protein
MSRSKFGDREVESIQFKRKLIFVFKLEGGWEIISHSARSSVAENMVATLLPNFD